MNKQTITWLILGALFSWLAGCQGAAQEPLTVRDLRLPESHVDSLHSIEDKTEAVDNYGKADEVPGMILMLRRLGISSTAYYKYRLIWEAKPASVKLKLNVFTDAETAATDFAQRYGPDFAKQAKPLTLGDGGLNFKDQIYAFRRGKATMELSSKDSPDLLKQFADRYAAYAIPIIDAKSR